MFSLIITIISIGLVAILAIASVYYGGTAFNSGNVKGNASTLVAQAQQISAARTMFYNDNSANPATIGALAPSYLQSVPTPPSTITGGGAWSLAGQVASVPVLSDPVCSQINVTAGLGSVIPTAVSTTSVYSCFGTGGTNTMSYVQ